MGKSKSDWNIRFWVFGFGSVAVVLSLMVWILGFIDPKFGHTHSDNDIVNLMVILANIE